MDYVGHVDHVRNADLQPNRSGHPGEIQLWVDSRGFVLEEFFSPRLMAVGGGGGSICFVLSFAPSR